MFSKYSDIECCVICNEWRGRTIAIILSSSQWSIHYVSQNIPIMSILKIRSQNCPATMWPVDAQIVSRIQDSGQQDFFLQFLSAVSDVSFLPQYFCLLKDLGLRSIPNLRMRFSYIAIVLFLPNALARTRMPPPCSQSEIKPKQGNPCDSTIEKPCCLYKTSYAECIDGSWNLIACKDCVWDLVNYVWVCHWGPHGWREVLFCRIHKSEREMSREQWQRVR